MHRAAGELALRKGELQEATSRFSKGYTLAVEQKDTSLLHRNLLGLSLSYIHQGQFDEAREHLDILQKSAEEHKDLLTLARHDQYSAIIHLQLSELEKAEQVLNKVILFLAKINKRKLQVEAVNTLGDVYRRMGKWKSAQKAYAKTLEIMEQINHPNISIPMLNMALVLLEQEDFIEAEPYIYRSLEILEKLNWGPMIAAGNLLALCVHAYNYNWEAWDRHFSIATDLLNESQYIDSEIALFAQKAGQITKDSGEQKRSLHVLKIAVEQWKALGNLEAMMEARITMLNSSDSNL